jgi:hypothetical protein
LDPERLKRSGFGKSERLALFAGQPGLSITEPLLSFVDIVRSATHLKVLDRRLPAVRKWHDVVELEKPRFGASACRADERAG